MVKSKGSMRKGLLMSMKGSTSSINSRYSIGGKSNQKATKDNISNQGDDKSVKSSFSRGGNSKIPRLFGGKR